MRLLPVSRTPLMFLMLVLFAGMPVQADNVALFVNDSFVDYLADPPPGDSEAANLEVDIEALGHVVTTFTTTEANALEAVLVGQDALVIPELEGAPRGGGDAAGLISAFGIEGMAVIYDFVAAGGNLVITDPRPTVEVINEIFSTSLDFDDECPPRDGSDDNADDARGPCRGLPRGDDDDDDDDDDEEEEEVYVLTAEALGTIFADGPSELPRMNATDLIEEATLPAGSLVFYSLELPALGAVAAFPVGQGWVFILGWDWYQGGGGRGGPINNDPEEIADWNETLHRAIIFPGSSSVLEVPLGPITSVMLAGVLLLGGLLVLRRLWGAWCREGWWQAGRPPSGTGRSRSGALRRSALDRRAPAIEDQRQ